MVAGNAANECSLFRGLFRLCSVLRECVLTVSRTKGAHQSNILYGKFRSSFPLCSKLQFWIAVFPQKIASPLGSSVKVLEGGSPDSCISLIFGFRYSVYSPRLHSRSFTVPGLLGGFVFQVSTTWLVRVGLQKWSKGAAPRRSLTLYKARISVCSWCSFYSPSIVLVGRQLLWWCPCVLQIKFLSLFLKFLIWSNVAGFKIHSYYPKEFEHYVCHLRGRIV